jgi:tetratricopeptide (TPR) repeat protein
MRRPPLLTLLGLSALLLAGAGGLLWLRWKSPARIRVDLQLAEGPWPGLSPAEVRGLRLILSDHLESLGDVTVTQDAAPQAPLERGAVRLRLSGARTPTGLALSGRLQQPDREDTALETASGDPMAAVHRVVDTVLGRWWSGRDALDPARPGSFWPLCRALDTPYSSPAQELVSQEAEAEALHGVDPSGLTLLARAHARYRLLLNDSGASEPGGTGWCDDAFQEALKALPDCPRLAVLYANFRTDVGDQRTALDLLFRLVKRRPHVASLYDSLAYAARTLGLLDGALSAIHQRDRLGGHVGQATFLAENTLLYRGEWEAFERSLEGSPCEPVADFYRGYAALLRRSEAEAKGHFRTSAGHPAGIKVFKRLSQVYLLALEGQRTEALKALQALDESRVSVKVPDGEFTFKLAEAYAYLGRNADALDVARRAFSQGFTCAEWYARSPFLTPLHGEPEWEAFLTILRERQRRLQQRFPTDRFGK